MHAGVEHGFVDAEHLGVAGGEIGGEEELVEFANGWGDKGGIGGVGRDVDDGIVVG